MEESRTESEASIRSAWLRFREDGIRTHHRRVVTTVNGELRGELSRHHTVRLLLDHRKQIIRETMQTLGRIVDDAELVHVVVVDLGENGVYITSSSKHPTNALIHIQKVTVTRYHVIHHIGPLDAIGYMSLLPMSYGQRSREAPLRRWGSSPPSCGRDTPPNRSSEDAYHTRLCTSSRILLANTPSELLFRTHASSVAILMIGLLSLNSLPSHDHRTGT